MYDAANQLTAEYNEAGEYAHFWTYDNAGNIQSRTEYAYVDGVLGEVTDTINYAYNDATWGDLLTSYDGQEIEYDGIGNPEEWGSRTFTWQHGRQLAMLTEGTTTWNYTYDANGMRTSRTGDVKTYTYTYNGSQLVQMTVDGNTLRFTYDAAGTPLSVNYNGTTYYYVTNLQGDVTGIVTANGTELVRYTYSSWGVVLQAEGVDEDENAALADTLAELNPLRYRGYVYDHETTLYYLQSRYYDPAVGRFVNADNQLSTGSDFTGLNLFAYCGNNPVNRTDPTGEDWWHWALGAVAAVAAVAVTVVTFGAAAPAAVCTLTAVGMSLGASYAVATAAATAAVVVTAAAAATYAGDLAYTAVTGESLLLNTVFQGNTDAYNTGLAITSIATAGMLEAAAQSPGVCFVAGTPVLAACGYIAIEEIKAGDMVWAENPETGEKELKEVVQTFVNETTELIYIQVGSEEIVTTPEHPFYSPIKGWIAACKLRAGDILVLQNGKYVTVEKVQHEILETPITVYNFEVADFHTYYVGKNSVLVHNTCGGNSSSKTALPKNGTKVNSSVALDMADDFLGPGYTEVSPSRFVSADGFRQVRMANADVLGLHGGGPHINFDRLYPNYKSVHIYIFDD